MKISNSYNIFTATITLLLTVTVIIMFKTLNIQDDVIKSEQHRFRSFSLAKGATIILRMLLKGLL
ncbi:MAG: hypothetical protein ABSC11_12000 [Smithella sp.]|jgi:hypothetical protein